MAIKRVIRDAWRKNAPELAAFWNGALPGFVTARHPRGPLDGVPVFSFHLVEAATFAADLAFLRENDYRTLSSAEFLEFLEGAEAAPERAVVLSFDDGPANFHRVAFPLLRQFGAKAIAFIAPGLHADVEDPAVEDRPMSWSEIQEIHASELVDFQSHTFESRFVPQWPLPVPLMGCAPGIEGARRRPVALTFRDDLELSRQVIEARLPGAKVNQLALPRYLGTEEAVAAAQALGFRACYWGLTPGRPLNRAGQSPLFISRVGDEFLRRLPGQGRIPVRAMVAERIRRVRAARGWRRRYAREL